MLRHPAVATLDRGWAPELVVVGREKGFPKWVAMRLPKRIAPWTFIRLYAKDGQAPVTTTEDGDDATIERGAHHVT